jgi:glycosyltransferase involved in cell wall biosynthesis
MTQCILTTGAPHRIGFIGTRFHGTDGVSLETAKWVAILREQSHDCFWMGGLLDTPAGSSFHVPLAYFGDPEVAAVQRQLFGTTTRSRALSRDIQSIKERLLDALYEFVSRFGIEVLVPQNALAIPMHVPLGLAITEFIAETGIPTIAHHHDFSWERDRFTLNAINDHLQAAFPPSLPRIEHVVINSMAQKELARRYALPSTVIPNILNFEKPAPAVDDYSADVRAEIGLTAEDLLILQPTRVVARKGIEHAVELVRRLNNPRAKLVISHPAGDEGNDYMQLLQERIHDAAIDVRFIADRVGEYRGLNAAGQKVYTLYDLYPHADLVTYPSYYEGFGNAFLEAVYFRKPVVVNTYAVYARDIAPLGFKTIEMSQVLSNQAVQQTREILSNQALRQEWAETNYSLGLKYFSYSVARRKLAARLANLFGEGL